jgi:uncharacterized protein YdaU (DUF1376 family)
MKRAQKPNRKLDWYAWYPGDFRKDTQHLTRDERHAYRDLIDEIFNTNQESCTLPNDDILLARITQRSVDEWKAMRHALIDGPRPLLQKRGKTIQSKRLTEEIRKAQGKSLRAKDSADSRWHPDDMRTHSEGIATASVSKSPSPSPSQSTGEEREERAEISEADFDELWRVYPNKDGRKQALRHFFATVNSAADLAAITTALDKYREHLTANPWKRPKNGSTWFNNWRDWENWQEPPTPPEKPYDGNNNGRKRIPVSYGGAD